MTTAVLLDVENLFRGAHPWDRDKVISTFNVLAWSIEQQATDKRAAVGPLRCYGKHEDPGTKPLLAHLQEMTDRRHWVCVTVVKGKDVADDVLVEDLKLMFRAGRSSRFVVGSGDHGVLGAVGQLSGGRSTKTIRVVSNSRHRPECTVDTVDDVPEGHEHVLDIYQRDLVPFRAWRLADKRRRHRAAVKARTSDQARQKPGTQTPTATTVTHQVPLLPPLGTVDERLEMRLFAPESPPVDLTEASTVDA